MGKHSAPRPRPVLRASLALTASMAFTAMPSVARAATGSPESTPSTTQPPTPGEDTTSTAPSAPAARTTSPTLRPTLPPARDVLREGDRGEDVAELQRSLVRLKYWVGPINGVYGHTTTQAVMALQKVAGIERDGQAGPQTRKAIASKAQPRVTATRGRVIEVNKAQQVLFYVRDGYIQFILNVSTGTEKPYDENGEQGVATTPVGTFKVYREHQGWEKAPLGELYSPKYFTGGYAIHGSLSIPAYPASHGCVRVSVPAMDMTWNDGHLPINRVIKIYE